MTRVQGETAPLFCVIIDTDEPVTQISWERITRGNPPTPNLVTILDTNGPIFSENDDRFKFIGKVANKNGSLKISNVTLMDEGTYTCIFTLFPSGNFRTKIFLKVLGKDVIINGTFFKIEIII